MATISKQWRPRIKSRHYEYLIQMAAKRTSAARSAVGVGCDVVITPNDVLDMLIESAMRAESPV